MSLQRYHRTTDQDRESLVECHENGEDFVTLAHNLGTRRLFNRYIEYELNAFTGNAL